MRRAPKDQQGSVTTGDQGLREKGLRGNLPATDPGGWVGEAATNRGGVNSSHVDTSARETCDIQKRGREAEYVSGS